MLKKYNLLSVKPWWKPSWTNCCGSRNSQLYPLDNLLRRTKFGSPHSNSLKNGCLMYGFFTTYTGWLWNWEGNVSNNCTPWWSTLEPTSKCKKTLSGFILFPIYLLFYKSMNTWSFSTCPMSNHPFQTKALVTQTIFISRLFGFVQNLLNQRESSQQYRKSAPIKVDRYENIACKVLYMTLHSATSKCENGKASSTCSMWCLICCTSAKTLSTKQPVRTYRGGQIWK